MNSFSEAIDYFDKTLIIDPKNKIILKWKETCFLYGQDRNESKDP
jgi:hypothetical protein